MVGSYPTLHTMNKGAQVRHLLIVGHSPSAMKLVQLADGVETAVSTGTQYEVGQDATVAMEEWRREGFTYRKDSDPPFEPFRPTLALLTRMGYTKIFDSECKKGLNLLGEVPLTRWQGRTDKLGNDYEYGYTTMKLHARPRVTAEHGVNMRPATNEEFVATIGRSLDIRKSLGPDAEFILG